MDNRKMVNRSRRSSNHFVSVFLNSYKQALEIARTVPYTIKLTILSILSILSILTILSIIERWSTVLDARVIISCRFSLILINRL